MPCRVAVRINKMMLPKLLAQGLLHGRLSINMSYYYDYYWKFHILFEVFAWWSTKVINEREFWYTIFPRKEKKKQGAFQAHELKGKKPMEVLGYEKYWELKLCFFLCPFPLLRNSNKVSFIIFRSSGSEYDLILNEQYCVQTHCWPKFSRSF